jgi:Polysaccharide biosynthesis enzyme WcbI
VRTLLRRRLRRRRDPVRAESRPLCVVYGNCHADPIRRLLERSPAFTTAFRTTRITAAHELKADQLDQLKSTLAGASLLITQPVRDDYRGLPIGSGQLAANTPDSCRTITIPALYYDATYPFQVYVRPTDSGRAPVPIVQAYHDLRFLHCAAQGWNYEQASAWLNEFRPLQHGIRAVAQQARERLGEYESWLDVQVLDRLTAPELHGRSFFTVDHPTNAGMMRLVAGIHERLGLPYVPDGEGPPLLGTYRTPLEPSVIEALELPDEPRRDWVARGQAYTLEQMLAAHLDFYAEHPDIVSAGIDDHAERMATLGIAA